MNQQSKLYFPPVASQWGRDAESSTHTHTHTQTQLWDGKRENFGVVTSNPKHMNRKIDLKGTCSARFTDFSCVHDCQPQPLAGMKGKASRTNTFSALRLISHPYLIFCVVPPANEFGDATTIAARQPENISQMKKKLRCSREELHKLIKMAAHALSESREGLNPKLATGEAASRRMC